MLYRQSGISVESWIEMTKTVPMRYEINEIDKRATLYFGQHANYVLSLGRDNLEQMISLAGQAMAELDAP
jgi:hypothetical protein